MAGHARKKCKTKGRASNPMSEKLFDRLGDYLLLLEKASNMGERLESYLSGRIRDSVNSVNVAIDRALEDIDDVLDEE